MLRQILRPSVGPKGSEAKVPGGGNGFQVKEE